MISSEILDPHAVLKCTLQFDSMIVEDNERSLPHWRLPLKMESSHGAVGVFGSDVEKEELLALI